MPLENQRIAARIEKEFYGDVPPRRRIYLTANRVALGGLSRLGSGVRIELASPVAISVIS